MGKKTFALILDGRVILKLDRAHQELLFEIRPETFRRFPVATVHWSEIAIGDLDDAELVELVREAWAQVVPKPGRPEEGQPPGPGSGAAPLTPPGESPSPLA